MRKIWLGILILVMVPILTVLIVGLCNPMANGAPPMPEVPTIIFKNGGKAAISNYPMFYSLPDEDQDGLWDNWEDKAMALINPYIELDEDEDGFWPSIPINFVRVTPIEKYGTKYILFTYTVTWNEDYGRHCAFTSDLMELLLFCWPRSVIESLTNSICHSHNGDTEEIVMAWEVMDEYTIRLRQVYTSAHEGTDSTHCGVWYADGPSCLDGKYTEISIDAIGNPHRWERLCISGLEFKDNRLKLYASEDKHALYPTKKLCEDVTIVHTDDKDTMALTFLLFGFPIYIPVPDVGEDCGCDKTPPAPWAPSDGIYQFDAYNVGEPWWHFIDNLDDSTNLTDHGCSDLIGRFPEEKIWSSDKFCGGYGSGGPCGGSVGSKMFPPSILLERIGFQGIDTSRRSRINFWDSKKIHNINNGKDFEYIQAAIDDPDTKDGHTITVDPGYYYEYVKVTKSLTIKSTSGDPTDTCVVSVGKDHVFEITADYVNISGFRITGQYSSHVLYPTVEHPFHGLYLNAVEHCNISDNFIDRDYYGIYLNVSNSNTITNNFVNDTGIGIYLNNSSSNTINDNWVKQSFKYGIYLSLSSDNNTIYNNFFKSTWFSNPPNAYDNGEDNIWNITKTEGRNIIGGVYLGGNYWSDYTGEDTDTPQDGLGNTMLPYNCNGGIVKGGDYLPLAPFGGTPVHNIVTGKDFVGIQAAIDDRKTKDFHTITVDPRVYHEQVIIEKSINLIGENRNVTIIEGDGTDDVVLVCSKWVRISGFTIQNGTCGIKLSGISPPPFQYFIDSNNNIITGNTITNNDLGISVGLSFDNIITGNTITNNHLNGIDLRTCTYNAITNNTITNNSDGDGIYLKSSGDNTITENTITHNNYGINLYDFSDNNTITGNTIANNTNYGIYLDTSNYNTISGNTIANNTNKSFYYNGVGIYLDCYNNYTTISGNTITHNSGYGIYFGYFNNYNTISGNTITDNPEGISFSFSPRISFFISSCSNNIISGNIITNSHDVGIFFSNDCSNNTIVGNTVSHTRYCGIIACNYTTISGNTITHNTADGIRLYGPSNTIMENTITNNHYGIRIWTPSSDNTIIGNLITHNQNAIYLYNSSSNKIYHNNFINNTNQSYDNGINSWDNGYPSGGNYWSDFDEPGEEAHDNYWGVYQHILGADGIVDKEYPYPSLSHLNPYNISGGNNQDMYPLMYPYPICDINRDKKINILDLVFISRHWGETWDSGFGMLQGDVNRDGVINILDMILAGNHWTG